MLIVASATLASAHTVITYPGWRGNNLQTTKEFPYGMQWIYPCGGMPITTNRTFWPTTGGAIAFEPGMGPGHAKAVIYVNLGFGTAGPDGGPPNMSNPMVPPFQILGPSNTTYPGTVCLLHVPLPVNVSFKAGDNATIQLIELGVHGGALYSCVDITFAEPGDPRIPPVNATNCFNSTDIGFADIVYTRQENASTGSSGATHTLELRGGVLAYAGYLALALGGLGALL